MGRLIATTIRACWEPEIIINIGRVCLVMTWDCLVAYLEHAESVSLANQDGENRRTYKNPGRYECAAYSLPDS